MPNEVDKNPFNNLDSIVFDVDQINSVDNVNQFDFIKINLVSENLVKLETMGNGKIIIKLYNILGQLQSEESIFAVAGQDNYIEIGDGISIIEVISDHKRESSVIYSW